MVCDQKKFQETGEGGRNSLRKISRTKGHGSPDWKDSPYFQKKKWIKKIFIETHYCEILGQEDPKNFQRGKMGHIQRSWTQMTSDFFSRKILDAKRKQAMP